MFDESTNVSIHQNMIMYVRVLQSDELGYTTPGTYFFGIDSSKQRNEAVKVCDQFVNDVVKSLNVRFSDNEDCLILTALSNFFNPSVNSLLRW